MYEADKSKYIPWPVDRGVDPTRNKLVNDLRHMAGLKGQFQFDDIARRQWQDFYLATYDEFTDEVTASYECSKGIHALKLAMCLSIARQDALVINFVDMIKAINMIIHVTDDLKKTFRAVGDSEMANIMDKVLRFIEQKSKTSLVTRQDLMGALWKDVGTSQNLDVILATLEAGHVLLSQNRSGVTTYKIISTKKGKP